MNSLFEGSYLGDASRIDAGARLECGICWHVYDPAEGDPVWQIAPGTPFAELPEDWRCPNCDAEKHKFMVLDGGARGHGTEAEIPSDDRPTEAGKGCTPEGLGAALTASYTAAAERMRGLPVFNPSLSIAVIGPRRAEGATVAVVATPWFLNILRVPDGAALAPGAKAMVPFPSGAYEFVGGVLDGVGAVETCSLISPMDEFTDMDTVRALATECLEALFVAPEPAEQGHPAKTPREVSRRGFLGGAGGGAES